MKATSNPVSYLTAKMWRYASGNRPNVVLYFTLFVIANLIHFLDPLIIAKLLNVVQELGVTQNSLPILLGYLSLLLLTTIGFWAFHGPARVIENTNAFLVRANYKKELLDGVMAFPIEWHTDHHSGDTIDKIEKGTRALHDYSRETFQIIEAGVKLASSYVALVYFNLHAGYIVLFMVILTVLFVMQFDKTLVRQYKEIYGAENRISERIFDVISNITTVIILRIERLVSSSIYKRIMEPLKLYIRNNTLNETKWVLVSVCANVMLVLVLGSYFVANLNTGSAILIGTIYALYGYVERINDLFYRFAYMYGDILQQRSAVLNAEEVANDLAASKKSTSKLLDAPWQELRIKGLNFSYHSSEGADLHLESVSFAVKRGQRVALIGASGSGKTTFLKLIRELYQPQQGSIYLDDQRLPKGFASISESIALIPQDPEIFSTTIRENITVGVAHDREYIRRFTDMACFSDVVERLPKGLESSIHEKGVNLSGGEKQRLALARGLMASDDKALVLFDEPTSSVDTKNELQIFQNIFKAFGDKTMIASVHRLHLLSLFDVIYFFRRGKVIASGTLDELLETSKEFKKLWDRYHKLSRRVDRTER